MNALVSTIDILPHSDGMRADFSGFFVRGMAAFLAGKDIVKGFKEINELITANLRKLWHLPV